MTGFPLLDALAGKTTDRPPLWLMRQAGRYLPEYRKVRAGAGTFVDLCLNPELAAEVTVQPIRRYGMDGAILFSDILMVPYGLGQDLRFAEGEGPKLPPIRTMDQVPVFDADAFHKRVGPIYETVSRTRAMLPEGVTMIGFAGSPWTVASYMVEGGTSRDFATLKKMAFRDPALIEALVDAIVAATVVYLDRQIQAGAQVVKLFDSWAGAAPETLFNRLVIDPTIRIVAGVKALHPTTPIIGFPRGAGTRYLEYAQATKIDAVATDSATPIAEVKRLQAHLPVQGNLDPMALVIGGAALDFEIDRIVALLKDGPFIFNLGHGIVPETPLDHVERLVRRVRGQV
ncbi:MAG: uroporphyrinogen decarboxylase [Alphaproteobacteria bacterium]|nr:uroporphyrinogen decarboxylase [Alphaproteobacteria bacterium]